MDFQALFMFPITNDLSYPFKRISSEATLLSKGPVKLFRGDVLDLARRF